MKQIILLALMLWLATLLFGQTTVVPVQEKTTPIIATENAALVAQMTQKERRRLFKKRNKEIRQLVKKYHKATADQKPIIKAQLAELVSQATDESMAWSKQRIAMEKENLAHWEQKIQEQQSQLDEVKARRVDEILSGEAQRRHKLAQKRWKKEIKDRKKYMK